MAHDYLYTVHRYTDTSELVSLGAAYYARNEDAQREMERIRALDGWSTLEVSPWATANPHGRCKLIAREGYAYLARKAFRGEWIGLKTGVIQSQGYKEQVMAIDQLIRDGEADALQDAFRALWAYCQQGV